MQQLHQSHAIHGPHLRYPLGCFQGPPQVACEIDAALSGLWPLDAVHPIRFPTQSWAEAPKGTPGTTSWLQHHVMREIHQLGPTLLAMLDRCHTEGNRDALAVHALITPPRGWGATSPVAVLRLHADERLRD